MQRRLVFWQNFLCVTLKLHVPVPLLVGYLKYVELIIVGPVLLYCV